MVQNREGGKGVGKVLGREMKGVWMDGKGREGREGEGGRRMGRTCAPLPTITAT